MTRHQRIKAIILEELNPLYFDLVNESYQHNVPENSETHFKLIMVAEQFENSSKVQRHRLINKLLTNEFNTGLHALSLQLYSPKEWQHKSEEPIQSPPCRGGYAHG